MKKVYHCRYYDQFDNVEAKGGITFVMDKPSKSELFIGYAICSEEDRFDRKKGVAIATKRLYNDPIRLNNVFDYPSKETLTRLVDEGVIRQSNGIPFVG